MKFILNEELSLQEKRLLERETNPNLEYQQQQQKEERHRTQHQSVNNDWKKWTEADKRMYDAMRAEGIDEETAHNMVDRIKQDEARTGRSHRDYWEGEAKDLGITTGMPSQQQDDQQQPEQQPEQQDNQQQDQNNQQDQQQDNQQQDQQEEPNSERLSTSKDVISGNEVEDKLLAAIKSCNGNGYRDFMQRIKSNINNDSFPFTKLMRNPRFSDALLRGIANESLTEASFIGNIKDKIANSQAGQMASNAVNKFKNSDIGKKTTTALSSVNPATYRKFATVYNAFLENDRLIRQLNYVDDKDAIIYDPNLYKLSPGDLEGLEHAINVDVSALQFINTEKGKQRRQELKQAVAQKKPKSVAVLVSKNSQITGESSLRSVIRVAANKSTQQKIEFLQGLAKDLGLEGTDIKV